MSGRMLKVESRRSGVTALASDAHDNDAEQAVLGAMLLDEAALKAAEILTDPMFYSERHRLLFRAMLALANRGGVIDPITLRDELTRQGDFERVGGMEYIAGLIDVVPTAAHIEHHARLVCRKWVQREAAREVTALADPALTAEQFAATIEHLQTLHQAFDGAAAAGLRGYNDREILALPNSEWLVDGLLLLAGLVLLVGRWGAGKTFLLIDLVMHVAAGLMWQGRKVRRGAVLYVYAEGSMRLRVAAWRSAHRVPPEDTLGVTFVPGTVNLLAPESVAAFVTDVMAERLGPRPVLIVLETLSRMTPAGDENSPETAGLVIAACERIQRTTGATVLLSHHTPWNPDQQRPRGHTKLPDAADAVFLLENEGGVLKLSCQKMREGEQPPPLYLKLTPHDGALVVDPAEPPPPESTDVDELLTALGGDTLTVADLAGKLGVSERTVERRLKDAGGQIVRTPGTGVGRRPSTYHRHVAPSRDNPLEGGFVVAATGNDLSSLARHGAAVGPTEREPGE
jgi:hypothetical protein